MDMKKHDTMGRKIHRRTAYNRVIEKTKRNGECLEYTGFRNAKGYGWVSSPTGNMLAHRVVWAHYNGATKDHVLHKCDNPPCVRIAHLFAGTPEENSADMVAKGRQPRMRGEASGKAKLTDAQIKEIRQMHLYGGTTQKEIAEKYGVHSSHVSRIVNNKRRQWG